MGESFITRRGGGLSAKINISNYSVLPASGRDNQVALINSTPINDVYCQTNVPANPAQGDVWIAISPSGNPYLQFGAVKVNLSSIRQYNNGAWEYIGAWYVWQNGSWITGRLSLIENGIYTGQAGITFSTRLWAKNGFTVTGNVTTSQSDDYLLVKYTNTKSTSDTNGYGGLCSSPFDIGSYSNLHIESRCLWSVGGNADLYNEIMVNKYNATRPDSNPTPIAFKTVWKDPSSNTWYYANADVPIDSATGDYCIYYGSTCLYYNRYCDMRIYNLYLE